MDWATPSRSKTEDEFFTSRTTYDALNRVIQQIEPHSSLPGTKFNIVQPIYNEANLLEKVDAWLQQAALPAGLLAPSSATLHAVVNIDYDAKGQRMRIDYNAEAAPIVTEYPTIRTPSD